LRFRRAKGPSRHPQCGKQRSTPPPTRSKMGNPLLSRDLTPPATRPCLISDTRREMDPLCRAVRESNNNTVTAIGIYAPVADVRRFSTNASSISLRRPESVSARLGVGRAWRGPLTEFRPMLSHQTQGSSIVSAKRSRTWTTRNRGTERSTSSAARSGVKPSTIVRVETRGIPDRRRNPFLSGRGGAVGTATAHNGHASGAGGAEVGPASRA
jgi:hypothetical protein